MATTVGLVKAALLAQLTTLFASDANVQVLYGPRGPVTRRDVVMIGNVSGSIEPAAFGTTRPRWEDYLVTVVASATRQGGTQQQATEGALALFDTVNAYLRGLTNENVGVAGVSWARVTGTFSLTEADNPELAAANSSVIFTIAVRARV